MARRNKQLPDLSRIESMLGAGAADGVKSIIKWGAHEDSPLVIELGNGREIHFDRTADLYSPAILARRASIAGCDPPHLTPKPGFELAKRIVAAADLRAEVIAGEEQEALMHGFLGGVTAAGITTRRNLTDKQAKYEGYKTLRDHHATGDGFTPPVALSIVLIDTNDIDPLADNDGEDYPGKGDRYIRVADFGAHVRHERKASMPWPTLHGLAREHGWQHPGELYAHEPGSGKDGRDARINVYIAPAGWENRDAPEAPDDEPLETASETPTDPQIPF